MTAPLWNPVVYRVYDADDRLIYIGATHNLPVRMKLHEQRSWWNDQIARIDLTEYRDRVDALAAETVAIQEEAPVFNVMHRQGHHRNRDFADWTTEDTRRCREWMRTSPNQCYLPLGVRDFVTGYTARQKAYRERQMSRTARAEDVAA